jgi:hypothetical protein
MYTSGCGLPNGSFSAEVIASKLFSRFNFLRTTFTRESGEEVANPILKPLCLKNGMMVSTPGKICPLVSIF